ncbi:MAG TPA: MarR family transcriptional regulator [Firmicutes bacterium]|nr:MarR family transcriptional regulator [Bacillota bacterium]
MPGCRWDRDPEPIFHDIPDIDDNAAALFHSFFRAMRLHHQLMFKLMSKKGLYPGQTACLLVIASYPGITQRELAEKLCKAAPTVAVMLRKMEEAGLVVREVDDQDRRQVRVSLTDKGKALYGQLNAVLAQFIRSTFGKMSPQQQSELSSLLELFCRFAAEEL